MERRAACVRQSRLGQGAIPTSLASLQALQLGGSRWMRAGLMRELAMAAQRLAAAVVVGMVMVAVLVVVLVLVVGPQGQHLLLLLINRTSWIQGECHLPLSLLMR